MTKARAKQLRKALNTFGITNCKIEVFTPGLFGFIGSDYGLRIFCAGVETFMTTEESVTSMLEYIEHAVCEFVNGYR